LHYSPFQGTHVAGTILALGGNGLGVIGVIRNGQIGIHIERLFDDSGLSWASDVMEVVIDCVNNGAHVISMRCERNVC
jgi:serine protease